MIRNRPPYYIAKDAQWESYTLDADGLAAVLRYLPERLPADVADACRALLDIDRELVLAMATTDIPPARLRDSIADGIRAAEAILGQWLRSTSEETESAREAFCDAVGIDYQRTPYWEVGAPSLSPYHVLPDCMILHGFVPEGHSQVPAWMHLSGVLRAWAERRLWEEIRVC